MGTTRAAPQHAPATRRPLTVSRPHDPAETQAHRAADVVARGGSVAGWSFASAPATGIHREEKGKPPTQEDKLKEAAGKAGEAALATPAGKALQAKVAQDPVVRAATRFLDTTAGKVVAGGAVAVGVGALAAAKQPLPFQAPALPLDRITPGLSAKVTVEGPLNAPTFVGLSLTYKEQGPKGSGGPSEKDRIAADTARLRAEQQLFRPQADKDKEKADEQAAIARFVAQQATRFGRTTLVPLAPGGTPRTIEVPTPQDQAPAPTTQPTEAKEAKEKEDEPVQRAPASLSENDSHELDTTGVQETLRGGGRGLDPRTRRTMESRFGYDFSAVRIHDDTTAARAAAGVDARAFTVGDHIGFAPGGFDPRSPEGTHLLAHELAHVVQQRGGSGPVRRGAAGPAVVQRVGILESLARFVGGGTYTTTELTDYLTTVRRTRQIEDHNDSDNKAREVVRLFVARDPAFRFLTVPDRVLLIKELISGFTGDDDEKAILDLLAEAIPHERMSIVAEVGADVLRDNIHGAELRRLQQLIESGEEDVAIGALGPWTVDSVLDILERHGDVAAVREMLRLGWTVKRFTTAFDKWRYDSGRVEESEITKLAGNTVRSAKVIRLRASLSSEQAAQTLFHELHHAFSPESTTDEEYLEDEVQARVAGEEFSIRHGLPEARPGYRKSDGTVDAAFIRKEISASPHYNPTGRRRIGRRYVGEKPTAGWRVRPTAAGRP